ncbi:MAG: glycosyltransferase family 4 protein [Betaproteobacteria bacterium]|nr:glycosyltransferase family 4 protein [Betaproteobacteria bacterium]
MSRAASLPPVEKGLGSRTRLAYLGSRYPAVSHTFILREVLQLRARGFDIDVASINSPDRDVSDMTPDERQEAEATYYVKLHSVVGAIAAHLWALQRSAAWLRTLLFALGLGGWNLRQKVYGIFYFTEALMLARWMESHGTTHLHVHFASAAANVALLLKQFAPVGLSLTVHGPDEFYDAPGQWLPEKIAAADFIICIGAFARSQLMHLSPASQWHKFEICPLGVDPDHYAPVRRPAEERPFTILCVGRLTPAKGQRILIDACRKLHQSGRKLQLVLVGAGPDETDLKAAVACYSLESVVRFTGALNQTEVRAWYSLADAFALASFAEGIPVVLMEAMASGIPCVSTRITGIPELIRDGDDGLLVTPSDTDELAAALARLMDDGPLRQYLARSGRARVQQKYNLALNAARLGRIFETRLGVHS